MQWVQGLHGASDIAIEETVDSLTAGELTHLHGEVIK
jgi:hypothetical protein